MGQGVVGVGGVGGEAGEGGGGAARGRRVLRASQPPVRVGEQGDTAGASQPARPARPASRPASFGPASPSRTARPGSSPGGGGRTTHHGRRHEGRKDEAVRQPLACEQQAQRRGLVSLRAPPPTPHHATSCASLAHATARARLPRPPAAAAPHHHTHTPPPPPAPPARRRAPRGLSAGVHRNTNVYMDASNSDCMAPSSAMRRSLQMAAAASRNC